MLQNSQQVNSGSISSHLLQAEVMAVADRILIDATKHGAHNLLVAPP